MKRLLLLIVFGAIAGALVVYLRRRGESASPAPAAATPDATLPLDPDRPGTAPGPEAREEESAVTDDTRFDRIAEEERRKRREAATRVQTHPLGEQPPEDEGEEG